MSTDLMTYLNFMANWEHQSETDIQSVIDEQRLFKQLDDFESDKKVDDVFKTIIDLAKKVRDETIEADAVQMAADAAAVASFWSFGMGMAAFASLEATEIALKASISKKSKELNEKMTTADSDIAKKINKNVFDYITLYKNNNNIIKAQDPKGMGLREARSNLMQFMSEVDTHYAGDGGLTVSNFVQMAASARIAFNEQEINDVYDALDSLKGSDHSQKIDFSI